MKSNTIYIKLPGNNNKPNLIITHGEEWEESAVISFPKNGESITIINRKSKPVGISFPPSSCEDVLLIIEGPDGPKGVYLSETLNLMKPLQNRTVGG